MKTISKQTLNNNISIKDVIDALEQFAPSYLQESFDNCGLLVGDSKDTLKSVLLCVDITEETIDEAISLGANLIVSHHPFIFQGLKRLSGSTTTERIAIKAIKNSIAIYAGHTNFDSVKHGISYRIGEKLSLKNMRTLSPSQEDIYKIVTFVPEEFKDKVKAAMCIYGGKIGEYDCCSYSVLGEGSFRPSPNASPYIGSIGEISKVKEQRIEVIVAKPLISKTIEAIKAAHPYQEPGYDIYPLYNKDSNVGLGIIGELETECSTLELLHKIKKIFGGVIRHTPIIKNSIKTVALCGGAGAEFLPHAISQSADLYISSDFKYHNFFTDFNRITIADIGHFESEECIIEIFYEIISKKIPNFAIHCTNVKSNPINYL